VRYEAGHNEKIRAGLLAEAGKAILLDGPHQVSVASVMKRAGMTHGSFYVHFESREAMLVAAIERLFRASRWRWRHETKDRPLAAGLAAYVDFYLSAEHRDMRDSGCVIPALASDVWRLSPGCRAAYAEGTQRQVALVAARLAELGHADAGSLARSVNAEMVGALALGRVEPDERRSRALLAASRAAVKRRLEV
jgi:TetR/AcrR family transcriptional repressor of nem operon